MAVLLAFTVEHAARVAGVSERRVRYWDQKHVLIPSLAADPNRRAPFSRIYTFQDVVGLRTLGKLRDRHGFSLQRLRKVGKWLQTHYDHPWSSLRFFVVEGDIFFRAPESGQMVTTDPPGQGVFPYFLEEIADEAETEAAKLTHRTPEQIGLIVQNRFVLRNAPVLAGTRIPTVAVWEFHSAGYDMDAILQEYPRLQPLDVRRAIAFEEQRLLERRAS